MTVRKFPPRQPATSNSPAPAGQPTPQTALPRSERLLRTMWTVGSLLSILLNVVLLVALIIAVNQLFTIKQVLGENLLGGLYHNFVRMDEAHIRANIPVQDNIPIDFVLNIEQDTSVVLTEDTRIVGARVNLSTGGLNIVNAPASIILPAGTTLPVRLSMGVPVKTGVPVALNVSVDIPLSQTELHEPFVGLQNVVGPYYQLIQPDWRTWRDVPACNGPAGSICRFIFADPQP